MDPEGENWILIIELISIGWGVYEIYDTIKPHIVFFFKSNEVLTQEQKELKICEKITNLELRVQCEMNVRNHYFKKQIRNSCEYGESITGGIKTFWYSYR